jgi:hypothetical protein
LSDSLQAAEYLKYRIMLFYFVCCNSKAFLDFSAAAAAFFAASSARFAASSALFAAASALSQQSCGAFAPSAGQGQGPRVETFA